MKNERKIWRGYFKNKKSQSDSDNGKGRKKELPKHSINVPDKRHMIVIQLIIYCMNKQKKSQD